MQIAYYCQHVLGVGHFFRSLEICRACSSRHRVTMIVGGPPVSHREPSLSFLHLPGLVMDHHFKNLTPCDPGSTLAATQQQRTAMLRSFASEQALDCLVIELYPFGRKAFRFELEPLLETVRTHQPNCRIWCSLRDILVEKEQGQDKHERRAVDTLNRTFDGLLIHADQRIVRLEETFTRMADVRIPVHYTGYVTPRPSPGARDKRRRALGLAADDRLVVASLGSGSVGGELLSAAVAALPLIGGERQWFLQLFAGPFAEERLLHELRRHASRHLRVDRFSDDFIDWLAAADLSISLAGYNTCMNIAAAGVPALLLPFTQNREQRLRLEKITSVTAAMRLVTPDDLQPGRLAELMRQAAAQSRRRPAIDLDGAGATVAILEAGR